MECKNVLWLKTVDIYLDASRLVIYPPLFTSPLGDSGILLHISIFNVSQLWDLTSGKLLHDFKSHTAASTCVEFHPKEFLLATASNDRFVFHFCC